jgi:DNA repair exonuclease SbcCD nuclease subunit
MRALLVGDVHIKEGENLDDTVRCLDFAVKTAREREVDVVLFGGDLFDRKSSPAERLVLRDTLLGLPCEAVLVRGNHEPLGDLPVFAGYVGVQVFEQPGVVAIGNTDVLCLPWPEKANLAMLGLTGEAGDQAGQRTLGGLVRGLATTRTDPTRPLVVLGHVAVGGAVSSSGQPLIGRSLEMALGDLSDLDASFVALSHIHKPQELAPNVHYVGSLTCIDYGEEDETKRIGLLDLSDGGTALVDWIPVPCRRWLTIEAKVTEDDGAVFAVERIAGQNETVPWCADIDELQPETFAGVNLRYRYVCSEEEAHLFDHAEIERRFAGAHTLKIVPQVERTERVRAAEVVAACTAEEKFRAYCQVVELAPTEAQIEKLHQLESEAANG